MKYNELIVNNIIDAIVKKKPETTIKLYKTLKIARRELKQYSKLSTRKLTCSLKFQFFMRACELDNYAGIIIEKLEVGYLNWETGISSKMVIRNASLINKIIRILSMKSNEVSDYELFRLLFEPFHTNIPIGYRNNGVVRDNSFVSSIYYDEILLGLLIDKGFSLTGYRFGVTEDPTTKQKVYSRYPGSISGLAKLPGSFNNYYQINQLDLTLIPQETLKFRLATSGYAKDDSIKKMINVTTLEYFLRRDILDLGVCDVKFEIYLTNYSASSQYDDDDEINISSSNSELFYVIVANRIISLLKIALAKQGNIISSVNVSTTHGYNDQKKIFNVTRGQKKSTVGGSIISKLSRESLVDKIKHSFEVEGEVLGQKSEKKSLAKLINRKFGQGLFIKKFLRMVKNKKEVDPKRIRSTLKIFKDTEVVMFLINLIPSKSRTNKLKLILSSADIISFFSISDFFVEGLGRTDLDLNTISWVASLDPKTIFNYFCHYICNKIILRRWNLYRRPFIFFSKDISRKIYYHQNDYLLSHQKPSSKIKPFLRVFAFDFEYTYHKLKRWKGTYLIISIIKKPKDRLFNVKVYVSKNCRVYSTIFSVDLIKEIIEDYISDVLNYLIRTPISMLAKSYEEILKEFDRRKPSQSLKPLLNFKIDDFNIADLIGNKLNSIYASENGDFSSSSQSSLAANTQHDINQAKRQTVAIRQSNKE